MKINKPLKIIGYVFGGLLILALLLHFGINFLIKQQLPKIIEEKNDTAYDLTYEDMNFSIFNNSISVHAAEVLPKKNSNIKKDIDFYGKIGKISVTGVNFYELLKDKNLKAYTIVLEQPDITVLKAIQKDTLPSESKLSSSIDIDEILIKNANLSMMTNAGDTLLYKVYNLNASIDGIHMGEYTVKKDIPFTYTDYKFKIDSVYTLLNQDQFMKSGYIDVSMNHILVDNVRLFPLLSSKQFKANETQSNTRMNISIPKVKLTHTDWGYDKTDFFVKVGGIEIDSINFHITDQKNQTVIQQAKKDAEKIIQPAIPFRLDIDSLAIKKSSFNSLGIVDVQNVNILVKKISNRVHERLLIDEFILRNPKLIHAPRKTANKGSSSEPSQLNDRIIFNKVRVVNADYTLKNKEGKEILFVKDFNLSVDEVELNDKTVNQNIPLIYKNANINTGKLTFDAGKQYMMYSDGLKISPSKITLKNMSMKPKMTREEHSRQLKWGEDYYVISTGAVDINGYSWGFDAQDEGYFKANEMVLNTVNTTIFRDASKPNEPKTNYLFSKKLRDINFNFFINSMKLKNSTLVYQETGNIKREPGKLSFTNFNLTATNIYSGHKRSSGPTTNIKVNTVFMKNSRLDANWSMNIMDRSDAFTINGVINNFDAVAMSPFLKPYLKVAIDGKINQMKFNFRGNDNTANGTFAMDYDGIKVNVLREDGTKKKFLSAVGNMVVRTDSKGTIEKDIKTVERNKENSFFNFLWQCILQGLKQTLI